MARADAIERPSRLSERKIALFLAAPFVLYFLAVAVYALANADLYAADAVRQWRYVFIPLALSTGAAALVLILSRDRALQFAMCLLASLLAVFAYEAVLTARSLSVALGHIERAVEAEPEGADFQRALPPGYTSKRLNNEIGVVSLSDAILGGLPDREVLLCRQNGANVTYRADQFGYNNPASAYTSDTRILILGDSFVEGICLPSGTDVVAEVRKRMDNTVGMGTRGAGPLFQVAALGRFGPVLEPDLTIIAFFAGNDWENLEREAELPWLQEALERQADFGSIEIDAGREAQAVEQVAQWWDEGDKTVTDLFGRRTVVRNFFALQQTSLNLGIHYPKASPDLPVFEDVLRKATELTASWNGEIALMYIPEVSSLFGSAAARAREDLREKVFAAAEATGVEVIDLKPVFSGHPEPTSLYAPDAHFSQAGAQLTADTIADYVKGRSELALEQ